MAIRDEPAAPYRKPSPAFPYIIGDSPRMQQIYALMQKLASGNANVCIQGENGTGKELIAQAIHTAGPRRDRPFITLDCTTVSEGLMESHLFGHVRGAFTGAMSTVPGVFARAHSGTLFIDEIAELAPHLQAKLLRAIQSREFTMVGGTRPQSVDVRVMTATNRDLREAARRGTFREDLYYRIAVVHVDIPPLRERQEDIPLLVAHFLRRLVTEYQKEISGLTARAMETLMAYSWPGNVRQLENWMEQAVVLAEQDLIDVEHFPSILREGPRPSIHGLSLRAVEKWYIFETLERMHWNRSKAARLLGISVRGLQYKLRRYTKEQEEPDAIPTLGARPPGVRPGQPQTPMTLR